MKPYLQPVFGLLLLSAAPAFGQEANAPMADPSRATDAARPSPFPDFEELDRAPMSRSTLQEFGACVARESPLRAASLLTSDFTTRAYARGLHDLGLNNNTCLRVSGSNRATLRTSDMLFAGSIAESLVEQRPDPVNVQLARAATRPPAATYSQSDKAAQCVVLSLPDDVARLFATEVASPQEEAAAAAIQPILQRCSPQARIQVNTEGLRAMLATAAFRSTQAASAGGERG
jgi:hypothetical protein